jgi:hypothetical protein
MVLEILLKDTFEKRGGPSEALPGELARVLPTPAIGARASPSDRERSARRVRR